MSRFTVVWMPDAEDELIKIWLSAADPASVSKASNRIDAELASNPLGTGDSVSEGIFRLKRPPLAVLFTIRESDCVVEIESVRHL